MRAILVFLIAACSNELVAPPPPKSPDVVVALASTRLGADCDGPYIEGKPGERIPCDQTAVQLSVRSVAGVAPAAIQMKRVELLDRNGKLLEVLSARSPRRWGTDQFVDWDERSVPGKTLAVGYRVKAPDWSKIPNPNQRSFKLRVTVGVDGSEQTFEATAELRIEDTSNVVT